MLDVRQTKNYEKALKLSWIIYSAAGANWLTFTIISVGGMKLKSKKYTASGNVEEIHQASWDGVDEVYALIKTEDGKGTLWAKIYRAGIENGGKVSVEISENGFGESRYIHTRVMK
jgi:hypothetical protein